MTEGAAKMRAWRATETGRQSVAARSRAVNTAAKWVIANHPEIWADILGEARVSVGLPVDVTPAGYYGKPIAHGTLAGYQQEKYRGIEPCRPCREAARVYNRGWRARKAQP